MKTLMLAFALVAGCDRQLQQQFVRTDASFTPAPRSQRPKVLLDAREIKTDPPLRTVGVLQVSGTGKKPVDEFLDKVSEAGRQLGCDAMLQADVFMLDPRVESTNPVRNPIGVRWIAGDESAWQFLCAVKGANTSFEAAATQDYALRAAAAMRDDELHAHVCSRTAPTGSHVPLAEVCGETTALIGRGFGVNH